MCAVVTSSSTRIWHSCTALRRIHAPPTHLPKVQMLRIDRILGAPAAIGRNISLILYFMYPKNVISSATAGHPSCTFQGRCWAARLLVQRTCEPEPPKSLAASWSSLGRGLKYMTVRAKRMMSQGCRSALGASSPLLPARVTRDRGRTGAASAPAKRELKVKQRLTPRVCRPGGKGLEVHVLACIPEHTLLRFAEW